MACFVKKLLVVVLTIKMPEQQLAEEVHKPIIKRFTKESTLTMYRKYL